MAGNLTNKESSPNLVADNPYFGLTKHDSASALSLPKYKPQFRRTEDLPSVLPIISDHGNHKLGSLSAPSKTKHTKCHICSKPQTTAFSKPLKQCTLCERSYHHDCHQPPILAKSYLHETTGIAWHCYRCSTKPKTNVASINLSKQSTAQPNRAGEAFQQQDNHRAVKRRKLSPSVESIHSTTVSDESVPASNFVDDDLSLLEFGIGSVCKYVFTKEQTLTEKVGAPVRETARSSEIVRQSVEIKWPKGRLSPSEVAPETLKSGTDDPVKNQDCASIGSEFDEKKDFVPDDRVNSSSNKNAPPSCLPVLESGAYQDSKQWSGSSAKATQTEARASGSAVESSIDQWCPLNNSSAQLHVALSHLYPEIKEPSPPYSPFKSNLAREGTDMVALTEEFIGRALEDDEPDMALADLGVSPSADRVQQAAGPATIMHPTQELACLVCSKPISHAHIHEDQTCLFCALRKDQRYFSAYMTRGKGLIEEKSKLQATLACLYPDLSRPKSRQDKILAEFKTALEYRDLELRKLRTEIENNQKLYASNFAALEEALRKSKLGLLFTTLKNEVLKRQLEGNRELIIGNVPVEHRSVQTEAAADVELPSLSNESKDLKKHLWCKNKLLPPSEFVHQNLFAASPTYGLFDAGSMRAEIEQRRSRKKTPTQMLTNATRKREQKFLQENRQSQLPKLLEPIRRLKAVEIPKLRKLGRPLSFEFEVMASDYELDDDEVALSSPCSEESAGSSIVTLNDNKEESRFNKMLGIPSNLIPCVVNGQLAMRDDSKDAEGNRKRARVIFKV